MQERIKEHSKDIKFACTQTSEHTHKTSHCPHWSELKFIGGVPHWYTCRVKEAVHIRLNPNNINRDNGIKIPEAWMNTIKKHNISGEQHCVRLHWIQKFGFISGVDNVNWPPCRDSQSLISVRWPIYIINSVDKTKFLYTTSPPTQNHSFFRNSPLHRLDTI